MHPLKEPSFDLYICKCKISHCQLMSIKLCHHNYKTSGIFIYLEYHAKLDCYAIYQISQVTFLCLYNTNIHTQLSISCVSMGGLLIIINPQWRKQAITSVVEQKYAGYVLSYFLPLRRTRESFKNESTFFILFSP